MAKRGSGGKAKRPSARTGGRGGAGQASVAERLHQTFAAATAARGPATRQADGVSAATVLATDAETRPVTFSTGDANHFIGITAGIISAAGPEAVSLMLPVGSYTIHWRVTGAGAFTLSAQGATLGGGNISSVAPDAGPIGITV